MSKAGLAVDFVIGLLAGKKGAEQVALFFGAPFRGVLTLFLLEVGLVTGRRLGDLKHAGWRLVVFAIAMPFLHGVLGVWLGSLCGMGVGGATILGTLATSASYIAAPADVRVALPTTSPAIYLTGLLALTFPFNVFFRVPASVAQRKRNKQMKTMKITHLAACVALAAACQRPKKALGHQLKFQLGRQFRDTRGRLFEFGKREVSAGAAYPIIFLKK